MLNHKLQHQQKENTNQTNSAKKNSEPDKLKEHTPANPFFFSRLGIASPPDMPLSPHNMMFLQKNIGNQAVSRFIQPKLKIGQPNDKYEQEADRVADMVMNIPEPVVHRKPT